jgi:DNA replication initiation complex subunit (GINS family)
METDEISYKNLRRIQQLEKTSPLLSRINNNFYENLAEYLKNLQKDIDQEKNPENIKLFQEEIKNIEKIAFSIYELREKKIVQAALSKVRGAKPDLKNTLTIEKKLFESIVETIIQARDETLKGKSKKEGEKEIIQKEPKKEEEKQNINQIVRLLDNVPEFIGTDMKTYTLRKDDVLSLSKEIVDPLLKRGVVKEIK